MHRKMPLHFPLALEQRIGEVSLPSQAGMQIYHESGHVIWITVPGR